MLLIDGHNLIGRSPSLSLEDEERSREALLRRVAAAQAGRREPVAVVFDGDRPGAAKETRFGGLTVVYAPAGRPADDEILRRLAASNPRAATVVTSDRDLGRRARQLGARVVSCEEFLERMAKPRGPRPPRDGKPDGGADEVDQWLELFRSAARNRSEHKM